MEKLMIILTVALLSFNLDAQCDIFTSSDKIYITNKDDNKGMTLDKLANDRRSVSIMACRKGENEFLVFDIETHGTNTFRKDDRLYLKFDTGYLIELNVIADTESERDANKSFVMNRDVYKTVIVAHLTYDNRIKMQINRLRSFVYKNSEYVFTNKDLLTGYAKCLHEMDK